MAGIFAKLNRNPKKEATERNERISSKLKHRGHKRTLLINEGPFFLAYHQRRDKNASEEIDFYYDPQTRSIIALDGFIFNLDEILKNYNLNERQENSNGQLRAIFEAYQSIGSKIFKDFIGTFSGILYDGTQLIAFKDPVGAKPLYYCETKNYFTISSELKGLTALGEHIKPVPPGCVIDSDGSRINYYNYPNFTLNSTVDKGKVNSYCHKLKQLIIKAIQDNIKEDENINGLLSGGIDSTLITHVAKDIIDDYHVFTVGIEGSQDIHYAKKYADLYNLPHTVLDISTEQMLDCLPNVIYALETYDAALIRSSVPMYLISEKIQSEQGNCVILTGEGGDELFGGYDYLADFNEPQQFNEELLNLLQIEHLTGLQRVDRIPYHFSIEARAPLFDRRLVEFSFSIPPEFKVCKRGDDIIQKWILRKAFDGEIPLEFIWREKQKFSDGAGSQFMLREYIRGIISDEEFEEEKQICPSITLRSKEELYYWRIFDDHFNPTLSTLQEIGLTGTFQI